MKKIIWGCLMVVCTLTALAQKTYRYRVALKDKAGTTFTLENPKEFLSERALERRNRQQLPVDSTDLPVSAVYLSELVKMGSQVVTSSKWNNTVVLEV